MKEKVLFNTLVDMRKVYKKCGCILVRPSCKKSADATKKKQQHKINDEVS